MNRPRDLRPWQQIALNRWFEADCHGIAEVVTGGGKTVFALAAVEAWRGRHPQSKVCVIVPTTALQDQWVVALVEDYGVPSVQVCAWPQEEDVTKPFHVLVVNTARRAMQCLADSSGSMMLIADECHRYASPANRHALRRADATLGLSATARREHDAGYEEILVPALGETIYRYGIEQARADGVIAPFRIINVEVPLGADEAAEYQRCTRRLGRAMAAGDEESAKRIAMQRAGVSKRARMRVPVCAAVVGEHRGLRTIVFHEDIAAANAIVRLLSRLGHSVAPYHTGIGPALRRDNLRQFRRGWIDVLVSCRALDEGIDVPEAEMAVIAAATSSQRQRIQRLGRVLRVAEGKECALVVTLYATPQEQERLINESDHLTDVADVRWRRAEVGNAATVN